MISSYLGLLSRRYTGQLDDDADEFIHFAVDGAARMSGMIEDLLQYSRIGTQGGELHPTNSGEALSEVLRDLSMAIEEGEAQIEVGDMPWVMADSTQLRRLLSNLIGNALKYRGEAIPEISIHSEFKNSRWEFTISDNGIGIDPEFHDRIFRIFQRLHGRGEYSGSGLGLAVCRKIVERHGGQIWVESRPLGGSLFVFTLGEAQSQKEAAKEF
jgi:light-regulated signal transduction histidine kinase (bacteriophytochrome)